MQGTFFAACAVFFLIGADRIYTQFELTDLETELSTLTTSVLKMWSSFSWSRNTSLFFDDSSSSEVMEFLSGWQCPAVNQSGWMSKPITLTSLIRLRDFASLADRLGVTPKAWPCSWASAWSAVPRNQNTTLLALPQFWLQACLASAKLPFDSVTLLLVYRGYLVWRSRFYIRACIMDHEKKTTPTR